MKQFLDYVKSFGELSEESLKIVTESLKEEFFHKDDYLLEAGEVCHHIRFILDGIVRILYFDKDGNEFTRYILNENHFPVNLYSYNDEIPSSEYLHAITDCRVVSIHRHTMNALYARVPEWTLIIKKITEKALLEKMEVKNLMLSENATQRYINFAERNPDLLKRVPLGYIAGFLGITQSSLSRIRKNISREHFLPYDKNNV